MCPNVVAVAVPMVSTKAHTGGQFVANGVWDGTYRDARSGCAAILRVLVEQGFVSP